MAGLGRSPYVPVMMKLVTKPPRQEYYIGDDEPPVKPPSMLNELCTLQFPEVDAPRSPSTRASESWSLLHSARGLPYAFFVACLLSIGTILHQRQAVRKADIDGDGILDHNDFCSSTNSITGWTSGRVTDFDGDGCRDGVEDVDRDNDGVHDSDDGCPSTPLQYGFVSNLLSDFDGDGCADSLEDTDNDGDRIPNKVDKCPRTQVDETPDRTGCSTKQHSIATQSEDYRWWEERSCINQNL
jgi:hypothetical protein